jgi:hypothetical protein
MLPNTLPGDQAHHVSAHAVARDQSMELVQGAPKVRDRHRIYRAPIAAYSPRLPVHASPLR